MYLSLGPERDHKAIYIPLSLSNETPRRRGLKKVKNSLLHNEHYVNKIREIYFQTCSYYSKLTDKRLFWEMLKMEIRAATISFSKDLAKSTNCREMEITSRLEVLDEFICNNFHAPNINQVLNEFDDLKTEHQTIYTKKGNVAIFRSKCRWVEKR